MKLIYIQATDIFLYMFDNKIFENKENWVRGFNLDKETYEMLTKYAKKLHISRSAVMRMLIAKNCGGSHG